MQLIVDRMQISREVLSSPELLAITGPFNRFDTTEIHCNEFFPNSTTATLTTAFASSPQMATLLLESFKILLGDFQHSVHFNLSDMSALPRPNAHIAVAYDCCQTMPKLL